MEKVHSQPEQQVSEDRGGTDHPHAEGRGGRSFEEDETVEGQETQEGHSDSTPPEDG